jgi:hypothetical protein
MNILIKLTCLVGLVIAPLLASEDAHAETNAAPVNTEIQQDVISGKEVEVAVKGTINVLGGEQSVPAEVVNGMMFTLNNVPHRIMRLTLDANAIAGITGLENVTSAVYEGQILDADDRRGISNGMLKVNDRDPLFCELVFEHNQDEVISGELRL